MAIYLLFVDPRSLKRLLLYGLFVKFDDWTSINAIYSFCAIRFAMQNIKILFIEEHWEHIKIARNT